MLQVSGQWIAEIDGESLSSGDLEIPDMKGAIGVQGKTNLSTKHYLTLLGNS